MAWDAQLQDGQLQLQDATPLQDPSIDGGAPQAALDADAAPQADQDPLQLGPRPPETPPENWWEHQPLPFGGSLEHPWSYDTVAFTGNRSFWRYYDGQPDNLDALDDPSSPFRGWVPLGAPIYELPPRWLALRMGIHLERGLQYLRTMMLLL